MVNPRTVSTETEAERMQRVLGVPAIESEAERMQRVLGKPVKSTQPRGIRGELIPEPDTFDSIANQIARGFTGAVTSIPKEIGAASYFLTPGFYQKRGITSPTQTATYRFGKGVQDIFDKLAPIRKPVGGVKGFATETLPQGLGFAAGMLAGGIGAKAIKGSRLAVMALMGASATGTSELEKAIEKGATHNEQALVLGINSLIGTSEAWGPSILLRRIDRISGGAGKQVASKWATRLLSKGIIKKVGNKYVSEIAKRPIRSAIATGSFTEFFQEFFQSGTSGLTARQVYDETLTYKQIVSQAMIEGTAGLILGGMMHGVGVSIASRIQANEQRLEGATPEEAAAIQQENEILGDAQQVVQSTNDEVIQHMADRARPKDMSDEQWATLRLKFIDELTQRIETGRWLEPETGTENANDVAARLVIQQLMDGTLKSENPDVQEVYDKTRREHVTPRDPTKAQAATAEAELRAKSISEIEAGTYEPAGESQTVTKTADRIVKHVKSTNKQAELQEQLATLEQPPVVEPEVTQEAPQAPVVEQEVIDEDIPTEAVEEVAPEVTEQVTPSVKLTNLPTFDGIQQAKVRSDTNTLRQYKDDLEAARVRLVEAEAFDSEELAEILRLLEDIGDAHLTDVERTSIDVRAKASYEATRQANLISYDPNKRIAQPSVAKEHGLDARLRATGGTLEGDEAAWRSMSPEEFIGVLRGEIEYPAGEQGETNYWTGRPQKASGITGKLEGKPRILVEMSIPVEPKREALSSRGTWQDIAAAWRYDGRKWIEIDLSQQLDKIETVISNIDIRTQNADLIQAIDNAFTSPEGDTTSLTDADMKYLDSRRKQAIKITNKQIANLPKPMNARSLKSVHGILQKDIDKKVKQELEVQGLTPTEVKPPGKSTQQAVARELKQAQEDILAALGRNKDGTIKAKERSFEGKQIFLKGNWFTVVDRVARQRYIREGNTAKEAAEAATRRWEVPPEEMGIIHKLLTGYNRVDKKTRRKMDNAVGFAFDNKYDLEQIKIMAQMGFPSKPVDPDTLNKIIADAIGYEPGDSPNTIRDKMETMLPDNTNEGKRKRREFGDFLSMLITTGMDQQLRKMGPEGAYLADGITNLMSDVRGMIGDWSTKWRKMLVKSQLSESQFDDWVSLHEEVDEQNEPFTIDSLKDETGKLKYNDDTLERMATLSQEFKALTDDIHKVAKAAGIEVEYIARYWPRVFKWHETSNLTNEAVMDSYIRNIAARHDVDETEAARLYELYYKKRREFYAPNLEEERAVDMPGYVRTPDAPLEYIHNAAQKIAERAFFGKDYEKVIGEGGLISQIPDQQNRDIAKEIFDRQFKREVGKDNRYMLKAYKIMQDVGTIRLVFSAIPNSTQTLMAGFRTTFRDFAEQQTKFWTGGKTFGARSGKKRAEMIERAEEIGAVMDKTNSDFWASEFLGVSPNNPILYWTGFTATEKFNAILASNMGMSYADRVLSKLSKVKPNSRRERYSSKELHDLIYSPTDIEQYGRNVHEVLKEYAQTHKGKVKLDELMGNKTKLYKQADLKASLDNGEITQEQFDNFSEITIGDIATKGRMRAGLRVLDDTQMLVTGRFRLPFFWNSSFGKFWSQFRSFSLRSGQLFYREFKRNPEKFGKSIIPYLMLSYLPHFGIARLREIIYGGNFDAERWDFIEPIIAAGIGAIPMQFFMAATYRKEAEALLPVSVNVLLGPAAEALRTVQGKGTLSVMIEEVLRTVGAIPGPQQVPFVIGGTIAAGQVRRMRREKPAITTSRPAR